MEKSHITPWVEWEILHPQLPILKISAHADQTLPLEPAGLADSQLDQPCQPVLHHHAGLPILGKSLAALQGAGLLQ